MKINKKWILGVIAIALCTSLTSQEAVVASSISQQQLTLSAALQAAQASIVSCKSQGIAVSVSVVDSNGLIQVKLKDDDASPLSTRLSQRKAFTAANFRKDTTLLADLSDTAVGRSEGILMSAVNQHLLLCNVKLHGRTLQITTGQERSCHITRQPVAAGSSGHVQ